VAKSKGTVRRSQLITTYGVGSIIALGDESFMVAGIDSWRDPDVDIHEPRLERRLRVEGFVAPPAATSENERNIPVVRFPWWCYCPDCRSLGRHDDFASFDKNQCPLCHRDLVPSRFVVACEAGHIEDFPYFRWVHGAGTPHQDTDHQLTIQMSGSSASLSGIVIACSCGRQRSMENSFSRDALKDVVRCRGRRPWLKTDDEKCGRVPRVLQRGSSNVWFSMVDSSISIPPWSEGAFRVLNRHWSLLRHLDDYALRQAVEAPNMIKGTPYTPEQLYRAAQERKRHETAPPGEGEMTVRQGEYEALMMGKPEQTARDDFVCVPIDTIPDDLVAWFDQVMVVKRLREVRALTGFTRVRAPEPGEEQDEDRSISPLFSDPEDHPDWLPAIEVLGEGVFFRLREEPLVKWETHPDVASRAALLNEKYKARFEAKEQTPDRTITPRLLLIHVLAHALINQWSLDCGYPAASLRERLYADDEMRGLLIFTATGDSAGSMGGVISLAQPARLSATMREAISRMSWCSADPLCIERTATGTDSLNLSACHACCLLPETSCEEWNLLLDRAVLVGTPEQPHIGFFAGWVEEQ
jgi:Domain of unknown function (DUF1998).